MTPIVFELYANLERLAGGSECRVETDADVATVGDALTLLARERPELAGSLERCACVSGDTIIRRADALPADRRIALLPPVAGG
ncbi:MULTISPECIES: MoaD/ThiS family protein [unclassified Luteibacter]|uniref:MoaD/ThiS family protein n=1 Tax=unclassified Luteibacter TaxID=2620188 RepID=UPI0008B9EE1C|nr:MULTISPECIES: MoaD/ThiS family protein [unclassified Luteibacter]MDR6936697.1 molybdopterin synthase sulfur carrier subunit [Luteibacter sp. 3190]SEO68014.1 molybdopterin synthase sulfur carrier subunit [Luteibacter sp. UNC138MFCol5.1]SEV83257.1 molybdopterin synthase sulfur carrier subunit [Luteibacter sp. 329MFSha]